MINQQNLPKYIEKAMPGILVRCEKENCTNIYDIIRQLIRYTNAQIIEHNMDAAGQCLELAANIYAKGNAVISNAIENIFVYSFSHTFFYDEDKRKEIIGIVPQTLYELYKKQVINSHL